MKANPRDLTAVTYAMLEEIAGCLAGAGEVDPLDVPIRSYWPHGTADAMAQAFAEDPQQINLRGVSPVPQRVRLASLAYAYCRDAILADDANDTERAWSYVVEARDWLAQLRRLTQARTSGKQGGRPPKKESDDDGKPQVADRTLRRNAKPTET